MGDADDFQVDVHGAAMDKAVQVMVLEGCMLVQQEAAQTFRARPGTAYFVNPGFSHVETAEVDSLLLVTQGEDRQGWM